MIIQVHVARGVVSCGIQTLKIIFCSLFSLWLRATPDQFKTYIQNTTASSKKVGAYLDLRNL
jgi:hypothetical protein